MKIEDGVDDEHETDVFADRAAHMAVAAATCGRSLRSRRFDTSGVYRQDYLKDLVQIAGPDRIIFGMNARYIRPRVERSRVEQHPQLSDEVTETVLGESIMPLNKETPAFGGPAVASPRQ